MTYTKAQRKAIAAAFRAAKEKLWDGELATAGNPAGSAYICYAIRDTDHRASRQAVEVVQDRLQPHDCMENWLWAHGVPHSKQNEGALQAHRHAWLDLLIKEFES